jgi:hypothetical protein
MRPEHYRYSYIKLNKISVANKDILGIKMDLKSRDLKQKEKVIQDSL